MDFTDERMVPSNYYTHRELFYWHMARYHYAKQFVQKSDVVIDVACGTGYGSYELAMIARELVAVDIDQATIDFAQRTFKSPNIQYHCMNATEIDKLGDEKFDVCTSFETIEHLSKGDQKLFLSSVSRILTNDGHFIVSTPNTDVYSGANSVNNEFHLHELNYKEFKEILEQYFEIVFIIGQRKYEGTGVKDVIIKTGNFFKNLVRAQVKKMGANFSQQVTDFEFPTTDIQQCLIYIAICRRPKKKLLNENAVS